MQPPYCDDARNRPRERKGPTPGQAESTKRLALPVKEIDLGVRAGVRGWERRLPVWDRRLVRWGVRAAPGACPRRRRWWRSGWAAKDGAVRTQEAGWVRRGQTGHFQGGFFDRARQTINPGTGVKNLPPVLRGKSRSTRHQGQAQATPPVFKGVSVGDSNRRPHRNGFGLRLPGARNRQDPWARGERLAEGFRQAGPQFLLISLAAHTTSIIAIRVPASPLGRPGLKSDCGRSPLYTPRREN